ncbi:hypothetical protein NDU88_005205 [Pleurodeles waltl]|uniref:Uncharacterized protein n=1 Tax=Pleurodeles waltl TaxID=8319 RepID=A0AAV7PIX5_PLEWA|nr:hypothetical protein NDU88_005205 [Pleurodeles waltl]
MCTRQRPDSGAGRYKQLKIMISTVGPKSLLSRRPRGFESGQGLSAAKWKLKRRSGGVPKIAIVTSDVLNTSPQNCLGNPSECAS